LLEGNINQAGLEINKALSKRYVDQKETCKKPHHLWCAVGDSKKGLDVLESLVILAIDYATIVAGILPGAHLLIHVCAHKNHRCIIWQWQLVWVWVWVRIIVILRVERKKKTILALVLID